MWPRECLNCVRDICEAKASACGSRAEQLTLRALWLTVF